MSDFSAGKVTVELIAKYAQLRQGLQSAKRDLSSLASSWSKDATRIDASSEVAGNSISDIKDNIDALQSRIKTFRGKIDVDDKGAMATLNRLKLKVDSLSKDDAEIVVRVLDEATRDLEGIARQAAVVDMSDPTIKAKMTGHASDSLHLLSEQVRSFNDSIEIKADLDAGAASAELKFVKEQADHLDGKNVKIDVSTRGVTKVTAALSALRSLMSGFSKKGSPYGSDSSIGKDITGLLSFMPVMESMGAFMAILGSIKFPVIVSAVGGIVQAVMSLVGVVGSLLPLLAGAGAATASLVQYVGVLGVGILALVPMFAALGGGLITAVALIAPFAAKVIKLNQEITASQKTVDSAKSANATAAAKQAQAEADLAVAVSQYGAGSLQAQVSQKMLTAAQNEGVTAAAGLGKAQGDLARVRATYTKSELSALDVTKQFKDTLKKFQVGTEPQLLKAFTKLLTSLISVLPVILPIAQKFLNVITGTVESFAGWVSSSEVATLLQQALGPLPAILQKMLKSGGPFFTAAIRFFVLCIPLAEKLAVKLQLVAERWSKMAATSEWQSKVLEFFKWANPQLSTFWQGLKNLVGVFKDIGSASKPMFEVVNQGFKDWTAGMRATMQGPGAAKFFTDAIPYAKALWKGMGDILGIFNGITKAALGVDWSKLGFGSALSDLNDLVKSTKGQEGIGAYFKDSIPLIREFGLLIRDLAKGMFEIGRSDFGLPLVRSIRMEVLPALKDMITQAGAVFGPKIVQLITELAKAASTLMGASSPVKWLFDALVNLVTAFNNLDPSMRTAIVFILGMEVALKAMLPFVALASKSWGSLLKIVGVSSTAAVAATATTGAQSAVAATGLMKMAEAAKGATGFFPKLWAAISVGLGPIGLAIAACALFVAAIYGIGKALDWLQPNFDTVAEGAKKMAGSLKASEGEFVKINKDMLKKISEASGKAGKEAVLIDIGYNLVQAGMSPEEAVAYLQRLADTLGLALKIPVELDLKDAELEVKAVSLQLDDMLKKYKEKSLGQRVKEGAISGAKALIPGNTALEFSMNTPEAQQLMANTKQAVALATDKNLPEAVSLMAKIAAGSKEIAALHPERFWSEFAKGLSDYGVNADKVNNISTLAIELTKSSVAAVKEYGVALSANIALYGNTDEALRKTNEQFANTPIVAKLAADSVDEFGKAQESATAAMEKRIALNEVYIQGLSALGTPMDELRKIYDRGEEAAQREADATGKAVTAKILNLKDYERALTLHVAKQKEYWQNLQKIREQGYDKTTTDFLAKQGPEVTKMFMQGDKSTKDNIVRLAKEDAATGVSAYGELLLGAEKLTQEELIKLKEIYADQLGVLPEELVAALSGTNNVLLTEFAVQAKSIADDPMWADAGDRAGWFMVEHMASSISQAGPVFQAALATALGNLEKDYLNLPNPSSDKVHSSYQQAVLASPLGNLNKDYLNKPRTQADGGVLPKSARIQGPGTLYQWAEPETGGESFIPLAPSKRSRSVQIWKETGKILGVLEERSAGAVRKSRSRFYAAAGGMLRKFAVGGSTIDTVPWMPEQHLPTNQPGDAPILSEAEKAALAAEKAADAAAIAAEILAKAEAAAAKALADFTAALDKADSIFSAKMHTLTSNMELLQQKFGDMSGAEVFASLPAIVQSFKDQVAMVNAAISDKESKLAEALQKGVDYEPAARALGTQIEDLRVEAGALGKALKDAILSAFNQAVDKSIKPLESKLALSAKSRDVAVVRASLDTSDPTGKLGASLAEDAAKDIAVIRQEQIAIQDLIQKAKDLNLPQEEIDALALKLGDLQIAEVDATKSIRDFTLAAQAFARSGFDRAVAAASAAVSYLSERMSILMDSSKALTSLTNFTGRLVGALNTKSTNQMSSLKQTGIDYKADVAAGILTPEQQAQTEVSMAEMATNILQTYKDMYSAEKALRDKQYEEQLADIQKRQDAYQKEYDKKTEALSLSMETESKAFDSQTKAQEKANRNRQRSLDKQNDDEVRAFTDKWDKLIKTEDDKYRDLQRTRARNEAKKNIGTLQEQVGTLKSQKWKTFSDYESLLQAQGALADAQRALTQQEDDWKLEDIRLALEEQKKIETLAMEDRQKARNDDWVLEQESIAASLQAQADQMQLKFEMLQQSLENEYKAKQAGFEAERLESERVYKNDIDMLVTKYDNLMNIVDNFMAGYVSSVIIGSADAGTAMRDGTRDMVSEALSATEEFRQAGTALMAAFSRGILAGGSGAISALQSVLATMDQYMPHSDAKKGPFKELTNMGRSLFGTFAKGAAEGMPQFEKMLEKVNMPSLDVQVVDRKESAADNSLTIRWEGEVPEWVTEDMKKEVWTHVKQEAAKSMRRGALTYGMS